MYMKSYIDLRNVDSSIFKRMTANLVAIMVFLLCALALIPGKALAAVSTYSNMVTQTSTLEQYANAYIEANPTATDAYNNKLDANWLVPAYIRSTRYPDTSWGTFGGGVPDGFVTYCAAQDTATGSDVQSLRTMDDITLPNGETTDAVHMFAAIDVAVFSGSSSAVGDLAGWIGDTNDLLRDVSGSTGGVDSASIGDGYAAAKVYFNTSGRFGPADVIADLDGYNIAAARIASPSTSYADLLSTYFTAELTDDVRVQTFCNSRLSSVALTSDDYRAAVLSAYNSNAYIAELEQQYGLTAETNNRTGSCYVVADYLLSYMPVTISYTAAAGGAVSIGSEDVEAGNGTAAGATATPNAGYHFVSWTNNIDTSETTDAVLAAAQVDAVAKSSGVYVATTFTANFAVDGYALSFDANGHGTAPAQTTVAFGATVTEPAAPTAPGYTFDGWYEEAVCTTRVDFSTWTMPASDTTLYAKWIENQVTISYASANAVQGSVSPTSEVVPAVTGTVTGSIATPSVGYHFVSWTMGDSAVAAVMSSSAGNISPASTVSVVSTDAALTPAKIDAADKASGAYETATFTANFTPINYAVNFDKNASDATGTTAGQVMTYGVLARLNDNGFTRVGYTFVGWNTAADGSGTAYAAGASTKNLTTAEDGSVTLYAQWTVGSTANTAKASTMPGTGDDSGVAITVLMACLALGMVLLGTSRRRTSR